MNNNDIDQQYIWHPYSAMNSDLPVFEVESANGVRLKLSNGKQLIDGMSSWWCVIHGYNHPQINAAITAQLGKMSHIMFGGLTHEPAIELTRALLPLVPSSLQNIFYSDSGSVAVEVAMKMVIQYWHAKQQPQRQRFISFRGGYHGDTFAAMSVCDPVTGMHGLFENAIHKQIFAPQPQCRFGNNCIDDDIAAFEVILEQHAAQAAAVILEPIVQGAGGMWFYSAGYLTKVRELCDKYDILLILDEIATGFGRTGEMFACQHADISPDIMCIGKSLTGGYLTLAATLSTNDIANVIDSSEAGVFMHGPTYMANPLACAAAIASLQLLKFSDWKHNVKRIEKIFLQELTVCKEFTNVKDVRVLGAIGVIEMKQPVNMKEITQAFVDAGVWVRPFGKLVYLMPPFIISDDDLKKLTTAVVNVVKNIN